VSASRKPARLANLAGGALLAFAVLVVDFPVILVVLNAFKSAADFAQERLLPSQLTWENFDALGRVPFGRYVLNSFIVSTGGTALAMFAAILAGYGISRFKMRGVGAYSRLLLGVQMVPVVVTLLPLFVIFKNLGLLDSYGGMILLYGALLTPFATWIAKSFFDTIPPDLEEAAWIDGYSRTQTLIRVVAPVAAPGLVSVALLAFITAWNEYLLASVFLSSINHYTVGVGLQNFQQQIGTTNWGPVMAGSVIAMLPTVGVYLLFQRYFVRGALAGAVKG
jgi:ABC-type glycerol-3-phosphate transport system permease component